MSENTLVSIIIVTYNSEQYIVNCLSSIFNSVLDITFEVIIADNHSMDYTKKIVKDNYGDIVFIENSENLGFAKANNQALRVAKGKYIFLLNPDTEVSKNALEKFYNYMENESDQNVWCVGGQLIDEFGQPSKSYGRFPNIFDVIFEQSGLKGLAIKFSGENRLMQKRWIDKSKPVPFVMGCSMFLKKKVLEEIGYFNELFFLNYEEVELCWRAKQKGFNSIVLPEVIIKHYSGKSFVSLQEYLNQLWVGQIIFFKLTRSRVHFNLIKAIHLFGALLRYGLKRDNKYLYHMKKLYEV